MSVNGLNMMKRQFLRVKQIADQTFQRGEKTELLNDDLSAAEKRVDFIKQSCQNSGKKLSLCAQRLATDGATSDRRSAKKIPEAALAQCMEEWGLNLGEGSILGLTMVDCARVQEALSSDLLAFKNDVELSVVEPLQNILKVDVANVAKCRKQLTKLTSELDASKLRHHSALRTCQQASSNSLATAIAKADSVKEEFEDISTKVEQCKDTLAAEMFSLISREPELSHLFVKLCHLQMEYHRSALSVLESTLPDLEAQINGYPYHPVFGQALEDHLRYTNREIALVLESCVCWLLEKAISEEGLFRIGGSITKIKKMKSAFDAGVAHLIEDERDPHNVAGVLKLYLRSLPEPLLTYDLYNEWIEAARTQDHGTQMQALWTVVNSLPELNFRNLRYLIKFLSKLCKNSELNKMSSQNVAIVMGPNLLWSPVEEKALGMNMTATNLHSCIVDILITYADWFFPGECEFYVSGGSSPRQLNGMSCSLRSSQLSLSTTKLSNGDSAVDSLSSSPTNSPKSPSPRVITRTKKKAAPVAPNSYDNRSLITRSLSCSVFQPELKDGELHTTKKLAQLSMSHEDLSVSYKNRQLNAIKENQQQNGERKVNGHKVDPPYYHSVPIIKPGRSNKVKSLPPLVERSHRLPIERPNVPPPERPPKKSPEVKLLEQISQSSVVESITEAHINQQREVQLNHQREAQLDQQREAQLNRNNKELSSISEDKTFEDPSMSFMDDSDFEDEKPSSPDTEDCSERDSSFTESTGTPTWLEHYDISTKDTNAIWFSELKQNNEIVTKSNTEDEVFDASKPEENGDQYCTIIPVGDGDDGTEPEDDEYRPLYKFSPPQDTSIKLRVNSHSQDTRL